MPSFFILSNSTTARTLAAGETGFIAEGATLYTSVTNAVTVSGNAAVTVMGSIVADAGFNAIGAGALTDFLNITVGQRGSVIASQSQALVGVTNNSLTLNNAGLIAGSAEAIRFTANAQTGVVADYHVSNSGTIQSVGDSTTENTIEFVTPTGGLVNLANTGTIVNGGAAGAVSIVGARLDLTNSGVIQCRSVNSAITTDLGNDTVDNAGTIFGGVTLNDGSDTLTNHGTITGNLALGNGSDRLVNTGTITGAVNLSDVLTTGAIADTVINAGLIIGDVSLGNGNDIFRSRGGVVEGTVFGGAGNDLYIVDRSDLVLSETSGDDTVRASLDFTLVNGIERLEIIGSVGRTGTGSDLANTLIGGAGDDRLRGLSGNDSLNDGVGDGEDVLSGGQGDDLLISTGGNDLLDGGAGFDTALLRGASTLEGWVVDLAAGAADLAGSRSVVLRGIEAVTGDIGADSLTGNSGANLLAGGFGADALTGGSGADTLWGESGEDKLTGGLGADLFLFKTFGDSSPFETDLITDFTQGSDHIDLSALGPLVFLGSAAFTGTADELRFFTDAGQGTTTIEMRLIGGSSNVVEITLTGIFTLTAGDFLL